MKIVAFRKSAPSVLMYDLILFIYYIYFKDIQPVLVDSGKIFTNVFQPFSAIDGQGMKNTIFYALKGTTITIDSFLLNNHTAMYHYLLCKHSAYHNITIAKLSVGNKLNTPAARINDYKSSTCLKKIPQCCFLRSPGFIVMTRGGAGT